MATIELVGQIQDLQQSAAVTPRSYYREGVEPLRRDPVALGALAVLVLIVGSAVLAPWLTTLDPLEGNIMDRLLPIGSAGHVFGTDEQGRDILARFLFGGSLSLLAGIIPVLIATVIGTMIGAAAAYFGGVVEAVLMRIMDVSY